MVRERSVALGLVLGLVTCGLYNIYWLICLADDINRVAKKNDMSGGLVFLLGLVTCGLFWVYWYYKAGETLGEVDGSGNSLGIACMILGLCCLGPISLALLQDKLNKLLVFRG